LLYVISIFKAYDVRGIYKENIDEETAKNIGKASIKKFLEEG